MAMRKHFEDDSTESVWYSIHRMHPIAPLHFEVDSTESVWYSMQVAKEVVYEILKLTPQSQYGIVLPEASISALYFEVDSTESVWYKEEGNPLTEHLF